MEKRGEKEKKKKLTSDGAHSDTVGRSGEEDQVVAGAGHSHIFHKLPRARLRIKPLH
jgi:hypothetical protein